MPSEAVGWLGVLTSAGRVRTEGVPDPPHPPTDRRGSRRRASLFRRLKPPPSCPTHAARAYRSGVRFVVLLGEVQLDNGGVSQRVRSLRAPDPFRRLTQHAAPARWIASPPTLPLPARGRIIEVTLGTMRPGMGGGRRAWFSDDFLGPPHRRVGRPGGWRRADLPSDHSSSPSCLTHAAPAGRTVFQHRPHRPARGRTISHPPEPSRALLGPLRSYHTRCCYRRPPLRLSGP